MDTVYAVMQVDISDGSGYKPQLICIEPSRMQALAKANSFMKDWLEKKCPGKDLHQSMKDGTVNFCCLHIWDEETCSGLQLSIQPIKVQTSIEFTSSPFAANVSTSLQFSID